MREDRDKPWTEQVTATAGNFSLPIIIPGWITRLAATAIPGGGGSALVQHTQDDPDDVEADPNNADWIAWDEGSVVAIASQAAEGTVTALRIQAVTADAVLKVAGERTRSR